MQKNEGVGWIGVGCFLFIQSQEKVMAKFAISWFSASIGHEM